MPRITSVATAVPPHRVEQSQAEQFARAHFGPKFSDIDRLLPIFLNSGIQSRYFSAPVEWFLESRSFSERNEVYINSATDLSVQVASEVIESADIEPRDIDYVIYVNTTGLATPSIDARVINLLEMRSDVRRTPIWGLGCAGGVAGLSHAYHHLLGHPRERVLVIATELCGLTFLRDDFSKSNLVATALFGEGSAAVLMTGDEVASGGLEVIDTRSTFYPDSLEVMGWNVVSEGLQVVFASRIPRIVRERAREDLVSFLASHGLALKDISAFLFHPGGTKVVEAYEEALALTEGALHHSSKVLRDYGNMSSVTVLFVLKSYLESNGDIRRGYGLLSALGPGFCSETVLTRQLRDMR
jgi:alkylresorcinol/alkylpyrone synthase